jgi:hypothetical protein
MTTGTVVILSQDQGELAPECSEHTVMIDSQLVRHMTMLELMS